MNYDFGGSLEVTTMGANPTYGVAGIYAFAPFSGFTGGGDVFTLRGSTTKIIRVKRVRIQGVVGSGVGLSGVDIHASVQCVTRSTNDQSGTSVTLSGFPYDPNDPGPTALPLGWSVLQQSGTGLGLGTLVGTFSSDFMKFTPTMTNNVITASGQIGWNNITNNVDRVEIRFDLPGCKNPTLRTSGQVFAVFISNASNFSGQGPAFAVSCDWTEEGLTT